MYKEGFSFFRIFVFSLISFIFLIIGDEVFIVFRIFKDYVRCYLGEVKVVMSMVVYRDNDVYEKIVKDFIF